MNTQTTNAGVTRALVRAVRDIRWEEIPADAREAARQCLLDFLGCAVAGSRQPLAQILLTEIAAREGSSEATLVGRQERCSRSTAAVVNGAAGHALDFDDTHMAMGGHPSVPVIPSALALAETIAANGRALLEAIIAGVELECRLGAIVGGEHYAIGFHSTGTLGRLERPRPVRICCNWTKTGGSARWVLRGPRRRGSSRPLAPWPNRCTRV